MRTVPLLLLAALAACTPPAAPLPTIAAAAPTCRVGPDGGPPAVTETADRGIGGTGAPPIQTADRGIGGTGGKYGILGVITGFASICLAGQEVAVTQAVPVLIDGQPAPATALRAGQIAAIEAAGSADSLQARQVSVRTEVSGPVTAASPGHLVVAGQTVTQNATTLGESAPQPGDWITVSGFARPDGTIHATRIDRRTPGTVSVRGTLARRGGEWRIGALTLRPQTDAAALLGHSVLATGPAQDGTMTPATLTADPAGMDPASAFGSGMRILALETYGGTEGNRLVINRLENTAQPDAGGLRRSQIQMQRLPEGGLAPALIRQEGRGRGPADISGPAASLQPGGFGRMLAGPMPSWDTGNQARRNFDTPRDHPMDFGSLMRPDPGTRDSTHPGGRNTPPGPDPFAGLNTPYPTPMAGTQPQPGPQPPGPAPGPSRGH